jgi:type IV secretion system protein VirB9
MKKTILALAIMSSTAYGSVTPLPGADTHVRYVDYSRTQPVNILCAEGVMTHIEFSEGEAVKTLMSGDNAAWFFADKDNHIFIKPLDPDHSSTNLTVITTAKSYEFNISVLNVTRLDPNAWTNNDVIHSLIFRYPETESKKAEEIEAIEAKEDIKEEIKERFEAAKAHVHNTNYWANGDKQIIPTEAHDDGNFVWLRFGNNGDFPQIYEVGKDNKKSLIIPTVDGNQVIIKKMAPRYVLRSGNLVAGIVNKYYTKGAQRDNVSGTVASDVLLKKKGVDDE